MSEEYLEVWMMRLVDEGLAPVFGMFPTKGAALALWKVTALLQRDYEIVKAYLCPENPYKRTVRGFMKEYLPLLRQANQGGVLIQPETLIHASFLVEAGYAICENDYEGIRIIPTKAGIKLLEKNP